MQTGLGWGIDLGVGSIGFALARRNAEGDPVELIDGVSHIFPASAGGAERRTFRSIRTQHQRHSHRIDDLEKLLRKHLGCPDATSAGCSDLQLPPAVEGGEPVPTNQRAYLRAMGLHQALTPGDLFKALLHIAHNRGQILTRGLHAPKDGADAEKEAKERKAMANGAITTRSVLAELGRTLGQSADAPPATPGQLLWERHQRGEGTRLRKDRLGSPIFMRAQLEDEVRRLLLAQALHHASLGEEAVRDQIQEAVFWTKEGTAPQPGRCMYGLKGPDGLVELRVRKASELFQTKRIYEELNNLRLRDRLTAREYGITLEQRDTLATMVLEGTELTIPRLRSALKLGKGADAPLSSLEENKRKGGKGRSVSTAIAAHPLAHAMAGAKALPVWTAMAAERREALFELLATNDDLDDVRARLQSDFGFDEALAEKLAEAKLPAGRGAAGPTATARLGEALRAAVISNQEAEVACGLQALTGHDGLIVSPLPYYGELFPLACVGGSGVVGDPPEVRYGRIPNPVVHTTLNRLRKLANAYVKRYGPPEWINLEVARDLNKSAEEREKIEKASNDNARKNDAYADRIRQHGARVVRPNLIKLKLFEYQKGLCLYTGAKLEEAHLFDGTTEIDHILPRDTGDESIGNLALVLTSANQYKAKRTPYAAFSAGYAGKDYQTLVNRVEELRPFSLWRFETDALEKRRKGETGDAFQSRYLADTRYVAKLSLRYLEYLVGDPTRMLALTGQMTAQMRQLWGIGTLIGEIMVEDGRLDARILRPERDASDEERKNAVTARRKLRFDHRHHLLDAIVAACVTRSDVQRIATLASKVGGFETLKAELDKQGEAFFRGGGMGWRSDFRATVKDFLTSQPEAEGLSARVSLKSDHNPMGELHAAKHYKIVCPVPGKEGSFICCVHQPLQGFDSFEAFENVLLPDHVLAEVKNAFDEKATFHWGGTNPVAAAENLTREQKAICDRLKDIYRVTYEQFKRAVESDPENKKPKNLDKEVALQSVSQFVKETGRRRYRTLEIKSLRIIKEAPAPKSAPVRAVATANNDRLIHWIDRDSNPHWEIVATIDAARPDYKEKWKEQGGRLVFRLRKNDVVEMLHDPKNAASERGLYRLAKFSGSSGGIDAEFTPIEEARAANEGRGIFTKRVRSEKAIEAFSIRHVVLYLDGRQTWASRQRN